ncbi:YtzI protein [Gottfriedia acidiceleris]|uniref:YtzI protein n=1 Tax=Gottfriedia acidiceleris TaxID=371036 RepID=UPI002FFF37DC
MSMTAVYVIGGIIIFVVFGAFVVTVNKGYGVKHKVDRIDDINIKNVYDDKNDK